MDFANDLNENIYIIKKHVFYIKFKDDVFIKMINFKSQSLNRYLNNHFPDFRHNKNEYSIDYNYNIIDISTSFLFLVYKILIDIRDNIMIISENKFNI